MARRGWSGERIATTARWPRPCVRSPGGRRARRRAARAGERAFCAGVDIADHVPERVGAMLEAFHGVFRALLELGRPTIALVNGTRSAAAASWSRSATWRWRRSRHVRLAGDRARLPAAGGRARAAGGRRGKGRRGDGPGGEPMNAARALAVGLVNRGRAGQSFDGEAPGSSTSSRATAGRRSRWRTRPWRRRSAAGSTAPRFLAGLARVETLYLDGSWRRTTRARDRGVDGEARAALGAPLAIRVLPHHRLHAAPRRRDRRAANCGGTTAMRPESFCSGLRIDQVPLMLS